MSFSTKEPCNWWLFSDTDLHLWSCNFRHPMHLRLFRKEPRIIWLFCRKWNSDQELQLQATYTLSPFGKRHQIHLWNRKRALYLVALFGKRPESMKLQTQTSYVSSLSCRAYSKIMRMSSIPLMYTCVYAYTCKYAYICMY